MGGRGYADARANLDDSLDLLEHAAEVYGRCDDANRRLCNLAFFKATYIDEDNGVTVGYATPSDALTYRELPMTAVTRVEIELNENEV